MKKIILASSIILQTLSVFSQSMGKGKNVLYLGAGAGTGYFGASKYKGNGYVYKSTPTIHLGFEHGISEGIPKSIIGLGGSLSTWVASQRYTDKWGFGWNKNWTDVTVLVKGYYHHKALVGEKWDVYATVMAGIKHRTYSYTNNDPFYNNAYADESGVYPAGGISIGGRYYITKSFGFYAEAGGGLNTDYVQGGFAFKF